MPSLSHKSEEQVEGVFPASVLFDLFIAVPQFCQRVVVSDIAKGFKIGRGPFGSESNNFIINFFGAHLSCLTLQAEVTVSYGGSRCGFFAGADGDVQCGGEGNDKCVPASEISVFGSPNGYRANGPSDLHEVDQSMKAAVKPGIAFIESTAKSDEKLLFRGWAGLFGHDSNLYLVAQLGVLLVAPACWVAGLCFGGSWWSPLVCVVVVCGELDDSTVVTAAYSVEVLHV